MSRYLLGLGQVVVKLATAHQQLTGVRPEAIVIHPSLFATVYRDLVKEGLKLFLVNGILVLPGPKTVASPDHAYAAHNIDPNFLDEV